MREKLSFNPEKSFLQIKKLVMSDRKLNKINKKSMCRIWVGETINLLLQNKALIHDCKIEIREVQMEIGLFHTFIKIIIKNEPYVLDGTGAGKHKPYFGLESNATHLQDSHFDILHFHLSSLF